MPAPWRVFGSLWKHRSLVSVMVKRDVMGRYKGSFFGLLWSLFNPLLMLAVYTLVFGFIFHAGRDQPGGTRGYAVSLFAGMIVFLMFADCVNRSPTLILLNTNYVKRVVFPLEILSWVALGSAMFHFVVSLLALLVASLILQHTVAWTIIFFPLPLICLAMVIAGLSWILSSLGVYLRDIAQVVTVSTNLLLFLSPVFYPADRFKDYHILYQLLQLNPLTFIIEQMRRIAIAGQLPNFAGLLLYFCIATLFAWLGLAWFNKTRKGFADVL